MVLYKMVNLRQILGIEGEASAAAYLKEKGYTVVAQNYRCTYGEVDIIAKDGNTLVFVEVKTRSSKTFGSPLAAVGYRKQQQISKTAFAYLSENQLGDVDARFDVISILREKGKQVQIGHVIDAFDYTLS